MTSQAYPVILCILWILSGTRGVTYHYDVINALNVTYTRLGCTRHVISGVSGVGLCAVECGGDDDCLGFSWDAGCALCIVPDRSSWRVDLGADVAGEHVHYVIKEQRSLRGGRVHMSIIYVYLNSKEL